MFRSRRKALPPVTLAAETFNPLPALGRNFEFDICCFCHSVFRNPKDDDHAGYEQDASKVAAFGENGTSPFARIATACEAAKVDLDLEDLDGVVPPGSVDFVLFYDAFEHVRRPVTALRKLLRMLRSGGRLHFTAQYYGAESSLPVRVGEPIYIDRHGLDARVHALRIDTKFRVTLEKK